MKIDDIGDIHKYKKNFSDDDFWEKIKKYAKKAGENVLEPALSMYYALQDKNTPMLEKGIIIGALGYFILPLDLIPDAIPIVGYGDDLTVLTAAIAKVAPYIKEEHKQKARETMQQWFG